MIRLPILFNFLLLLILLGCAEETTDTTPPTISITSPVSGQTVSEIVHITVVAQDNEGVMEVEFFIDDSLHFTDSDSLYEYSWNTSWYDDESEHSIVVVSHDESGNSTESQPILIIVDNTDYYPSEPYLFALEYENGSILVAWTQNHDDDFAEYTLYESESSNMSNRAQLFISEEVLDTTFTRSLPENEVRFFMVTVTDIYGLVTESAIRYGSSYVVFNVTFGGDDQDHGESVQQTDDGGYIIAGYSEPIDNGYSDALLIKADASGEEEWVKTFGGNSRDRVHSVMQTDDGGYILAGTTYSFGSNGSNVWLVKTDSQGTEEWNHTLGSSAYNWGKSIDKTSDGGFIIAGYRQLAGIEEEDVLLIKTDSQGSQEWSRVFGNDNDYDHGHSVKQTSDTGFIIVGYTEDDVWLIKTNSLGYQQWDQTFDDGEYEWGNSVQQTSDGDYIIISNFALIKCDSQGNEVWAKGDIIGDSVQQTTDGGYVIIGSGLTKTDANGNVEWDVSVSGNSIQQTTDGGYIIAGGYGNIRLTKTDPYGNTVQME
jgi:hypothetical protein